MPTGFKGIEVAAFISMMWDVRVQLIAAERNSRRKSGAHPEHFSWAYGE